MQGAARKSLAALVAAVACGLSITACGDSVPGNAVARVGDFVVTRADFNHWMQVASNSSSAQTTGQATPTPVPDAPNFTRCIATKRKTAPAPAKGQPVPSDASFKAQCQSDYNSLRDQVMQFLISADWIQGEASDQGVAVSKADTLKQFNTIKAQQFPTPSAFQSFLTQSGMNLNDLLFRVHLDALSTKLRNKVTGGHGTVTPAQIRSYYNAHKADFGQPERRDLRLVLTKDIGTASKALAALRSGQSFATVAKRYSIDQASKAQGGALLGVAKGQQEAALDNAVFSSPVGALRGPVKTQFGYYVFRVQKITPATQQSLAQATPTIKSQLATQNQQSALTTFVTHFRAKWTSRTNCRSGYVVQSCKNAPKTSTAATPGAGAPPVQQGGAGAPQGAGGAPQGAGGAPQGAGGAPQGAGGAPQGAGGAPQGAPAQGGAPGSTKP